MPRSGASPRVRDPGGGDVGLSLAVEHGLVRGPRFLYGGKALSQTGGHGDMRPGVQEEPCNCAYSGVICQVVDGVDEVRKVARDELRKGADHVKVFISGGVASPSDPIWMPQFTNDELRAAVEEAATRRKYVIAHCHTDDGARRCVETGIRSIDHASHVTDETARLIAEGGVLHRADPRPSCTKSWKAAPRRACPRRASTRWAACWIRRLPPSSPAGAPA